MAPTKGSLVRSVALAIARERLRSIRRLSGFRFAGISIAYVLNFLLLHVLPEAGVLQASHRVFTFYWIVAAVVFLATSRLQRIATVVGLDILLIDMPFVFFLERSLLSNDLAGAQAIVALSFYSLLVMAAAFSLQTWKILLAAGTASAFELTLLRLAQMDPRFVVLAVGVISGVAALCVYNTRRTLRLVDRVASDQLFLSPQVAELVEEKGLSSVTKQDRVELSAVVCDIRGFTAFAEEAPLEGVATLLTHYYDVVGEVVAEFGGTVKDHAGDGVLSLVGAPVPLPDHAARAVALALKLRDRGTEVLSRWRAGETELGLGIGVASGPVIVGAIGGATRLEYVAIGPAVNLAARLCQHAGSGQVLVDERCVGLIGNDEQPAQFHRLPPVSLKGFSREVLVFSAKSRPPNLDPA